MRNQKDRKVYVEYRDNVTPTAPLQDRTYTMTHSDDTGDLFVTIGLDYAPDKTNEIQDQVYLKWIKLDNKNLLLGEVLVDGEDITGNPKIRNEIFRREMPLALQAIYVADSPFFKTYPSLADTPVLINFKSSYPQYNKLYSYGPIGDYHTRYKHI